MRRIDTWVNRRADEDNRWQAYCLLYVESPANGPDVCFGYAVFEARWLAPIGADRIEAECWAFNMAMAACVENLW